MEIKLNIYRHSRLGAEIILLGYQKSMDVICGIVIESRGSSISKHECRGVHNKDWNFHAFTILNSSDMEVIEIVKKILPFY